MILSYNLNEIMKRHVLPEKLAKKSLKGLRFHLICLSGRIIGHARRLIMKVGTSESQLKKIGEMREKIIALVKGPPTALASDVN